MQGCGGKGSETRDMRAKVVVRKKMRKKKGKEKGR